MRCAIMQPTFLPWPGYFRLMRQVAVFVFLDDVQLSRQSWQTRNRVLVGGRVHWISAPVKHAGLDQTIADTELVETGSWRAKMARLLRQGYARHPFVADLQHLIDRIEGGGEQCLADLNIALIVDCASRLGITPICHRSTAIGLTSTHRTERLIEICRTLRCDSYLAAAGSAGYLEADGFRDQSDIELAVACYEPPTYPQQGQRDFVSHLSIIDVVANLGWQGAAHYISGPWLESGDAA
jgi:hypothetical protein